MKRKRKFWLIIASIIVFMLVSLLIVVEPSWISRVSFIATDASYQNWDDILSNPQPITVKTYETGTNATELSGIMNLDHENAVGIEDEVIPIPVNVFLVQHSVKGAHLIDGGLDASFVDHPYGVMKGLLVKSFLAIGSQEPGTNIAAVLDRENTQLQGVWMTHLHFDHTAGIVDLPKDIPYYVGENERYANFRFFMHSDHLAGIDQLYELDFSQGIDLPPFGMSIDIFGDGSFWAISSSGHSTGHVMYFVNGIEEQVLVTGDACNTQQQFDTAVGPGYYSSDLELAQKVLEQIIAFKERYPEVRLAFGHD